MNRVLSRSNRSSEAFTLVESLQARFVRALEKLNRCPFIATEWLRDDGRHGGGLRCNMADSDLLGRASVNISQVQYDDEPGRKLGSASALSAIVHPAHPHMPSVHIHISWTEQKGGVGYWRMMADLNPAIPNQRRTDRFIDNLRRVASGEFDIAAEQGDRYFYIPALGRHRGTAHFYLENFNTGDFAADLALAQRIGEAAIDGYVDLLKESYPPVSDKDRAAQLAYHTLYFFQVLTLDRGTTAGLLVHNENDIGILGSLPPKIDINLISSWRSRMVKPQDGLLNRILAILPDTETCTVDDGIKQQLADVLRRHYQVHPEALDLQASGYSTPPTIDNHKHGGPYGT